MTQDSGKQTYQCKDHKDCDFEDVCDLPCGAYLFRKPNGAGGYTYFSDEISGGIEIWDTALTGWDTLLVAIAEEIKRQNIERFNKRKKSTE